MEETHRLGTGTQRGLLRTETHSLIWNAPFLDFYEQGPSEQGLPAALRGDEAGAPVSGSFTALQAGCWSEDP